MPSRSGPALAAIVLLAVGAGQPAAAAEGRDGGFADSFLGRLEALALLETLNAELLSRPSATQTLADWCEIRHLAVPARILARRAIGADKPADAETRRLLGASADEPIGYRRVALACGDVVLSNADNWYRRSKLTDAMNQTLDATDTPFGTVVRPLKFRRRTLEVEVLFKPLPDDWPSAPRPPRRPGRLRTPEDVLRHRAVLETPDGTAFSLVVETYTRAILSSPSRAKRGAVRP